MLIAPTVKTTNMAMTLKITSLERRILLPSVFMYLDNSFLKMSECVI